MSDKCDLRAIKAAKGLVSDEKIKDLRKAIEQKIDENELDIHDVMNLARDESFRKQQRLRKEYNYLTSRLQLNDLVESVDFTDASSIKKSFDQKMVNVEKRINKKIAQAGIEFTRHIKKHGALEAYKSNKFNKNKVAEFMSKMTRKDPSKRLKMADVDAGLSTEFRIAEGMFNTLERNLRRKNNLGADVKFLEGRIMRNSYTQVKFGSPAKKAAFKADLLGDDYMDWKTVDTGKFSREEFVDTLIQKINAGQNLDEILEASQRTGLTFDLSNKLGKSRSVVLKPEKWLDFQNKYGDGDLVTIFKNEIKRDARAETFLQTFGTKPEETFDEWIDTIHKKGVAFAKDGKGVLGDKTAGRAFNYWNYLSGNLSNPANYLVARVGNSVRSFEHALHLGGVTITSVADVTTPGLRKVLLANTSNPLTNIRIMGESLFEQFQGMVGAHGDDFAKREVKIMLEEFEDAKAQFTMESRFAGDYGGVDASGRPTEGIYSVLNFLDDTNEAISKFNMNEWWTQSGLARQYPVIAREFGEYADVKFADLPDMRKQQLQDLQLDGIWDLMRSKVHKEGDRAYIAPSAFNELTDAEILKYDSTAVSARAKENVRVELRDKLQGAFAQEAEQRVLIPDVSTSPNATFNLKSGTIGGELHRTGMQFRSFGIAYWKKLIAPAITNQGIGTGLLSVLPSVAPFILGTNMMITWATDLLNGKTPRSFAFDDDADVETYLNNWVTLLTKSFGYPFVEDIAGNIALGKFSDRDIVRILGPGFGDLLATGKNISGIIGSGGDSEKINKNLAKMAFGSPVIGPLLQGHIFGKTMRHLIIDNAMEAISPGHMSSKARYAEEQGSKFAPNYEAINPFQ